MYNYQAEKHKVFSEDGQVMFLKIRDRAHELIKTSGAATLEKIIAECSGDSWAMIACVDRLVEIQEIREIPTGSVGRSQKRIFYK